jgi:hypothetical protein
MPTFKSFWAVLVLGTTCFGQVRQHAKPVLDTNNNVFTGSNQFYIGAQGLPKTFATLPIGTSGTGIYCSDCQQTNPCARGGAGEMANGIDGAWNCVNGGGGSGNVSTTPGAGISHNIVQAAGTRFGSNIFNQIRYPSQYNWIQSPSGTLTGGVQSIVTLTAGVLGIDTSDISYWPFYVYVAGTGTPEAVIVTGGTYTASAGGTIIFTPANSHSAGFTVRSASGGIAEASIDAGKDNQHLILNPGANYSGGSGIANAYYFYAPVYFKNNNITVDCGAAVLVNDNPTGMFYLYASTNVTFRDCWANAGVTYTSAAVTNTACASNVSSITSPLNPAVGSWVDIQNTFSEHYWGVHRVVSSSSTRWTYTDNQCTGAASPGSGSIASQATGGGNAPTAAFLIDNNEQTTVENITLDRATGIGSYVLNNGVIVLNDQAFSLRGGGTNGVILQCNANYCGTAIYAPGPFGPYPAVLSIRDFSASLNCAGNGIKDLSGNVLTVDGTTVFQGYAQYAVMVGKSRGGYGGAHIKGMYNEIGGCGNPMWTTGVISGMAGVIDQGEVLTWEGGEGPQGAVPSFASGGSTTYYYWLVVHDSTAGASQPLFMGTAQPSGSAVTVNWWRVPDLNTTTYDIIRDTTNVYRPYTAICTGGSTSACGSVATGLAQCTTNLCSYSDSVATNTTSYTLNETTGYFPTLYFWPAGFVLSNAGGENYPILTVSGANIPDNVSVVSTIGILQPSVYSLDQSILSDTTLGTWVSTPFRQEQNINGSVIMAAQLIQDGQQNGGQGSGYQGVLNLQHQGGIAPLTDEITLADSAEPAARSLISQRPPMNAADTGIGWDNTGSSAASAAQLQIHTPNSISEYIGVKPDNRSWLTRLASSGFALGTHLNQSTAGKFAGICTMSSATSCTITLSSPYTSAPGCVVTVQGATAIAGACSVSGTTVTITAASSNSATWAAMLFGNPN